MEMNGEMSEGRLRQCLVVDVELWNLALRLDALLGSGLLCCEHS